MKQFITICILLFIIACTKQQPIVTNKPIITVVTPINKLLDKTWYLYSRNSFLTNNKFTTRNYGSNSQLVTDLTTTAYTTTDYWTFKYQNSGIYPNDTITILTDTSFYIRSYQPAMGTYIDYYKLK